VGFAPTDRIGLVCGSVEKLRTLVAWRCAVVSPGFRYGTVKKVFTAVPNQLSPLLLPLPPPCRDDCPRQCSSAVENC
jgi:hypothetical protein